MGWTINDFEIDREELKKILHTNKDINKEIDIKRAINQIDYFIRELKSDGTKSDLHRDENTETVSTIVKVFSYKEYYPVIENFINIANESGYDFTYIKDIEYGDNIDESSIHMLVHDFYNSCGDKISNIFSNIEKDKEKIINYDLKSEDAGGVIYHIPMINKNYISLNVTDKKYKNVLNYLTHEYGHSIGFSINDKKRDSLYQEIESQFFEILGAFYYYETTKDAYYIRYLDNMLNYYVKVSKEVIDLKTSVYDNIKSNSIEKINEEAKSIDIDVDMIYLYGFLCAIELFELYMNNSEDAINKLELLINNDFDGIIISNDNILNFINRIKHVNND